MEIRPGLRTGIQSKTQLIDQVNGYLRSGDYSRALDLLRRSAAELPNDAELAELETLAQDGVKRNAEANRLISESQELFANRKSTEAIQLLREAYELDKKNSLARSILANALVEHAYSIVETDWWEAAKLAKQALGLNPAHPTAKSIRSLIQDRKETSSIEEWISQVQKLQSSGDLMAALSLIAEGLDIHSRDPKLLLLQDAIQRDQDSRRRQARRGDLEDLRRMANEVDAAEDAASKRSLAERIQAVAAKYWTDGEVISVANGLLQRLGLISQESASTSSQRPRAPVIFHVPPPSGPEASLLGSNPVPQSPVQTSSALPGPVPVGPFQPTQVSPKLLSSSRISPKPIAAGHVSSGIVRPGDVAITSPEPQVQPTQAVKVPEAATAASADKVTVLSSSREQQPMRSKSAALILVSAVALILVAAIFFFVRRNQAPPLGKSQIADSTVSKPAASAPVVSAPAVAAVVAPDPARTAPEPTPPASEVSSEAAPKNTKDNDRPAEAVHNRGALLVIAGQDDARVFLNGKPQRQLTQGGQLRIPDLEFKDYVVKVSKSGFLDAPPQKIRIRNGEQASVIFTLQPQPRLASLNIQGGAPGTLVLVDQTSVGTIQPDGTLSVSNVNPGDHTIELRKERFKPRQLKRQFVAGGSVSLAAADAVLEAAPGELKITFSPPDATVALVKGDLLKMVSSGAALNLAPGTYTLTARTAERFTRSANVEVIAGQSKTLDLSLAPSGMSKWDDSSAWKHEGDTFIHKGGDFVLYGVAPTSGTFVFSATLAKGHFLQWVLNYSDSKNYVLFQMDDNNFYRTVIRKGEKSDEIIVPHKGEKKSFRTIQIRVSPTELMHQVKNGDSWIILDRWTQPGANLSLGKFGFYIPGNDQVALSSFVHYADLNIR